MRFAGFVWDAVCRARACRVGACRVGAFRVGGSFRRAGRAVAAGRAAEGAAPAVPGAAATRHALASATPSATSPATPSPPPSGRRPRAPLASAPRPAAPRPAPLPPIPRPASAGGGSRGSAGGAGRGAGSGGAGSGRSCFGRSRFGGGGRAAGLRRAAAALLLGALLLPGGLLLAGPAEARKAASNLGKASSGTAVAFPGQQRAQKFTTGPQKGGYRLDWLLFDIADSTGLASRVKVAIHENKNSRPGDRAAALTTPATIATGRTSRFTAPAGTRLNADTTYWAVVTVTKQGSENNNSLNLRSTASDDEDSGGLQGWTIADSSNVETGSGNWPVTGNALKMHIDAAIRIPAPPPPGADAAVGNLAQDIIDTSVGAGTRARYQGFITGNNPDGYELKSIQVEIDRDFTGATADVTAELWRTSHSGDPGASLIPLNKPGTITAGTNTFTAPAGLFLDRNTTYYLAIGSSGEVLHLSRTEANEPNNEDPGALPGWSIGDTHRQDKKQSDGGGLATWNNALRLRINATEVPAPPDAAVGNIAQARHADTVSVNNSRHQAQAFTTGTAAHGYRLSAIQLDIKNVLGGAGHIRIAIHEDSDPDHPGTAPGNELFALSGTVRDRAGLQTFTAPAGAMLARGTTYFVTVTSADATTGARLRTTAANAEDGGGLGGWSMDDSRYDSAFGSDALALRLRVRAHPLPPPAADSGTAAGNLAQIPGAGVAVTGPAQVAQAFTTGPIAAGYEVESVQVQFDSFSGSVPPRTFVIIGETSGAPDFFRGTHITVTRQATLRTGTNTFTAPAGAVLQPNTTYYVTTGLASGSSARYGTTASGGEDPGGLDGWSVADRRRTRAHGSATWSTGSADPLRIRINAREAPPADPAANVAVSNTGQSTASGTAGLTADQARWQRFTTGSHAGGYTLHGVDLDIASYAGASAGNLTVKILAIHDPNLPSHASLVFDSPFATLANPATIRPGLNLFTAPPGTSLDAGTNYWVLIDHSGADTALRTTASDNEDSGGLAGWGIFDGGHDYSDGSSTFRPANALKIRVRASEGLVPPLPPAAGPDAAVGNLGRDTSATPSQVKTAQAQGFATGPQEGGYELKSVQIEVHSFAGSRTNITAALHTESSGLPGPKLADLGNPAAIVPGTNAFTAPAGTILDPGTTYYVTIAATTGSIKISKTPSNAEDPGGLAGWSIADFRRHGTGFAGTFGAAFKLRINATPPPPAPPPPATANAAVSNLGKRAVANASASVGSGQRQAQAFTTGPQVGGYDLESVEVELESGGGTGLTAAIHAVSGGNPGAKTFDLARTGSTAGVHRFAAPAGATLDAETTYILAISGSGSALSRTALGTEDDGALPGWTIADSRRFYNGSVWSRGDHALKIRVNAVKPDIARLAYIGVGVGTTSESAELSPAFDPGTLSYWAAVANDVRTVKLVVQTQTASQGLEYLDGDGNALADAALAAEGFQVALGVGTTIAKVKVTAPGRTAATTYTLALLRQALCSAASAQNRIWTGNLAVAEGAGQRGFVAGAHGGLDDTDFAYRGTARSIGSVVEGDNGSLAARIAGGAPADLAGLVLHIGESRYPLADATREGTTWTWTGNAPGWDGGDAACLALTAPPDTVPPTLLRAAVRAGNEGAEIFLTFDEALDPTSKTDKSAFTVTVEGNARAVSDAGHVFIDEAFKGFRLEFSDADAIRHGERVTVAYTKPAGDGAEPLKDLAGNEAESFDATDVVNGLEAPAVVAPDPSSFPVAVANYGGDTDGTQYVTTNQRVSQEFTTGTNSNGYYLRGVSATLVSALIMLPSCDAKAAIHKASGSNPGAKIADLRNPATGASGPG